MLHPFPHSSRAGWVLMIGLLCAGSPGLAAGSAPSQVEARRDTTRGISISAERQSAPRPDLPATAPPRVVPDPPAMAQQQVVSDPPAMAPQQVVPDPPDMPPPRVVAPKPGLSGMRPPRVGVVWSLPDDPLRRQADLRAIAASGFRAVRTGLWVDSELMDLADSLGVAVLQEIPLYMPTATALRDTLTWLAGFVDQVRAQARLAGLGLAYAPQTSDTAVCAILKELDGRLGPGILSYVTSWSEAPDPCANAVDLVLYDAPGRARLVSGNLNLASLGAAADSSEIRQAERLGSRLPARMIVTGWTFVYRWADQSDVSDFDPVPRGKQFGLHATDGASRPAMDVVDRALTRGQTMFSRPPDDARGSPGYAYVLLGWVMILAILSLLVTAPRLSAMGKRYMTAHRIYLVAVAEGRDQLLFPNLVLLIMMAVLVGLVGQLFLGFAATRAPFHMVWYWAAPATRSMMDLLAASPPFLVTLIGLLFLLVASWWILSVNYLAARRRGARLGQVVMLVTWPCWPLLLTLPIMMLYAPHSSHLPISAHVAAFCAVALVWSTLRTLVDTARVWRPGLGRLVLLALLSPVSLSVGVAFGVTYLYPDQMAYLMEIGL